MAIRSLVLSYACGASCNVTRFAREVAVFKAIPVIDITVNAGLTSSGTAILNVKKGMKFEQE